MFRWNANEVQGPVNVNVLFKFHYVQMEQAKSIQLTLDTLSLNSTMFRWNLSVIIFIYYVFVKV